MSVDEYVKVFNSPIKCSSTTEKYKFQNSSNGNWIQRAKDAGKDLSDYKKKLGESVKLKILSDPEERANRSKRLSNLNKRQDFRQRSSETAKITSSREEMLKIRSQKLAEWRDNHRDDFYEKCIQAMHSSWHSKPEKILKKILIEFDEGFSGNQRLYDSTFTAKSKRKQVDIMNLNKKLLLNLMVLYTFCP